MPTTKLVRTLQDLLVWQKAHRFVLDDHAISARFPKHETHGLSLQMRRATVSIPANTAEGSVEECRCFLSPDFHIPQGYQGRSPWLVRTSLTK
jgi:hypothetical protein